MEKLKKLITFRRRKQMELKQGRQKLVYKKQTHKNSFLKQLLLLKTKPFLHKRTVRRSLQHMVYDSPFPYTSSSIAFYILPFLFFNRKLTSQLGLFPLLYMCIYLSTIYEESHIYKESIDILTLDHKVTYQSDPIQGLKFNDQEQRHKGLLDASSVLSCMAKWKHCGGVNKIQGSTFHTLIFFFFRLSNYPHNLYMKNRKFLLISPKKNRKMHLILLISKNKYKEISKIFHYSI